MNLFKKIKKNVVFNDPIFDKNKVVKEILDTKSDNCRGWDFFLIEDYEKSNFCHIKGDFLAIYTDVINKEIRIKGNPYSEYKNIVECAYQIVREIYITDDSQYNPSDNIFKRIDAKSAKELFIKLKKEQE